MQHFDDTFLSHFLVGAASAAAFECLKLYDLKHKLNSKKYQKLFRSRVLWLTALGMLAASGFFAWVFYPDPNATAAELAIAGIASRSLIRDGISAITAKKAVRLGADDEDQVEFRDLFQ